MKSFSSEGDYQIPNLAIPHEPEYQIGVWARRRLDYLKQHRRVLFVNLLTSGKLYEHRCEIDTVADERHETVVRQMAAAQGTTERLKAEHQMEWVGRMNII